jgi:hypothetical protein
MRRHPFLRLIIPLSALRDPHFPVFPAALKTKVANRGVAPDSFLTELIAWAKVAPSEIFAPNTVPVDIFTMVKAHLATPAGKDPSGTPIYHWDSLEHRRAALCEVMRVHAGMESSWRWDCGVDVTNAHSVANIRGQETGIFQVSFDSLDLGCGAMVPFAKAHGIDRVEEFIPAMKRDHQLALEYYARLVRVSVRWAGPIIRQTLDCIYPSLSRSAVAAFQRLLL